MFRPFSAKLGDEFDKEKYTNGYLRHNVQRKSYNTNVKMVKKIKKNMGDNYIIIVSN